MNPTEVGAVIAWQVDSAPVKKFPDQQRVARADFDFVMGVGQEVGSVTAIVNGAASGTGGAVALAVSSAVQMQTGDVVTVSGVTGTTEANGTWPITVIDATHILLQGSVYANAFVSGGTVVDKTSPPNAQNPSVAISMSKDGGNDWGNPILRSLGRQKLSLRTRVSVTRMGITGTMGVRWRLVITDPVYASLLGGTMASEIRAVGN